MQEILYGLLYDVNRVGDADVNERFPFIESRGPPGSRRPIDIIAEMTSPRLIKTHMQREFFKHAFKKNAKFIVVIRNPKDVLVSYYNFYKLRKMFDFRGDFNEFFEIFKQRRLVHGDWFDWVLDWWQEKENPNVYFVTYEAMKADVQYEVKRVAAFLGREVSDEYVKRLVEAASFNSLKERRKEDGKMDPEYFRKGIVGDWVTFFNEEQRQYVDTMYEERIKAANIELNFDK